MAGELRIRDNSPATIAGVHIAPRAASLDTGVWQKRHIFYDRIALPGGESKAISLRTADRDEAIARRRELEVNGDAEWLPREARRRSVAGAAELFLTTATLECHPATVGMHRQKTANLCRILGDRPIASYRRPWTLELIEARLADGVSRHTIAKELTTLRGILYEAMARGWLRPQPMRVLVPRFRAAYVPRTSAPTPEQAARLLGQLEPKRRLWVLLALAGLRRSEIEALDWSMVHTDAIAVPGTKTHRAQRTIPRPAFLAVLDTEARSSGPVVATWSNARRDLAAACSRAGIPRFTATDLRRAYATWLRAAGVESDVIARLLGHAPGSAVTCDVYVQAPPLALVEATGRLPALAIEEVAPRPRRSRTNKTS